MNVPFLPSTNLFINFTVSLYFIFYRFVINDDSSCATVRSLSEVVVCEVVGFCSCSSGGASGVLLKTVGDAVVSDAAAVGGSDNMSSTMLAAIPSSEMSSISQSSSVLISSSLFVVAAWARRSVSFV